MEPQLLAACRAEAAARKAAEREARKAEKASLEAKEDAELASMKGVRKRGTKTGGLSKVAAKRAARAELAALQAALAADGGASTEWATGIDAALAATAAPKKASEVVERHPERRQKAAYKAWEPSAMAALKEEQPGLRRTQYKERLAALWRKAPENPMNSETKVAYNAKVDDTAGSEK